MSESSMLSAVIVLGDFNAHLGQLGGARGVGEANVQGVLLNDMFSRCHLNTVLLGSVASGPDIPTLVGKSRPLWTTYLRMKRQLRCSLVAKLVRWKT